MKNLFDTIFTSPELKKKMDSEQFKFSNILLEKRIDLELDFTEVAKLAGFSENEYIKLEYGDIDVPISEYKKALKNLKNYENRNRSYDLKINNKFKTKSSELDYQTKVEVRGFSTYKLIEAA